MAPLLSTPTCLKCVNMSCADTIIVMFNIMFNLQVRAWISLHHIQYQMFIEAKKWLLQLYNQCLATRKLPKIWKKAHVTALLKPGKDPSLPKSYRPISLLSHTYKLFERLILNRVAPVIDERLLSKLASALVNLQPVKFSTLPSTSRMAMRKEWSPAHCLLICQQRTIQLTTDAFFTRSKS